MTYATTLSDVGTLPLRRRCRVSGCNCGYAPAPPRPRRRIAPLWDAAGVRR